MQEEPQTFLISEQAKPSASFAKKLLFLITGLLGIGSVLATLFVLYHAFLVIGPEMSSDRFFIFKTLNPEERGTFNSLKLYDSYRIFFIHLPSALASGMISIIMAACALFYLLSKNSRWETFLVAATQVGIVSCFITMVTGYFWAEFAWGQGWTWEPRLTSTLILWLSYIALFALRASLTDPIKRRTFTAAYALLTLPIYPLVSKAIDIFGKTSHPADFKDLLASPEVAELRGTAIPALLGLFLFFILVRYLQLRLEEEAFSLQYKLNSDT